MITSEMFKGLISLNLFLDDYKSRGHSLNFITYICVFLSWIIAILLSPLMLFIDFMIVLYDKFLEKSIKNQFITKTSTKKRNK